MLIQQFRYDNYRLHQLGNSSVFTLTLQAGLSAIKTPYPPTPPSGVQLLSMVTFWQTSPPRTVLSAVFHHMRIELSPCCVCTVLTLLGES
jgi:hypothetical protein